MSTRDPYRARHHPLLAATGLASTASALLCPTFPGDASEAVFGPHIWNEEDDHDLEPRVIERCRRIGADGAHAFVIEYGPEYAEAGYPDSYRGWIDAREGAA